MNTMRLYRRLAGYFGFLLCLLLLAKPTEAAVGFSAGLELCCKSILPALFPFFILSGIIMKSNLHQSLSKPLAPLTKLCGIKGAVAPGLLLLSWLGGYAVCAAVIQSSLTDDGISSRDATILLLLGCCSSPGFVIGYIGGQMLGSVSWGVLLYFFQIAASLLTTAFILPFYAHFPSAHESHATLDAQSLSVLDSAIHSSLSVCGCVLFFRTFVSVLDTILPLAPNYYALVCGLLEISSGCYAFSQLGGGSSLYGICILLSALSLSVFTQLLSILHAPHSLLILGLSRVLHLIIFLSETCLCVTIFPPFARTGVFSTLAPRVVTSSRVPPDAAFCVILFFCCLLYNLSHKIYNREKQGGSADVQENDMRK